MADSKRSTDGDQVQDAAKQHGFESSYVILVLFPQVVNYMADNIAWTKELGQAFTADRQGVLDSVQRLRAQSQKAGNLKTTPQQKVETKTTSSGDQVIVIEPANPQVVMVLSTTHRWCIRSRRRKPSSSRKRAIARRRRW